jgi:predicted O-methyltransferase YrrM
MFNAIFSTAKSFFLKASPLLVKFDEQDITEKLSRHGLLKFREIFTHMTPEESFALFCTATSLPNKALVVEIGSYLGSSSCFICSGLPQDAKLVCIDTWENHAMRYDDNDVDADPRDTYQEFVKNTEIFSNRITKIRKWSDDAAEDVRAIGKPINFLFIDGDHHYESVLKDWLLYSPLLDKRAYIAFHDTGWAEGVQRVVAEYIKPLAKLHISLPNLQIYTLASR